MNKNTIKPEMTVEAPNGQFRLDFIKWAKRRTPFRFNKYTDMLICSGKNFFDLPLAFQFSAFSEFADSEEYCIHIEPYLGGGQPAYFASVKYRNEHHVDMQLDVDNSGTSEFWTRFEATEAAVIALNDLYNKQYELLKGGSNV